MTERWLPVPGYEGLYRVSDHGRVFGVRRSRVLSPSWGGGVRGRAALSLTLYKEGHRRTRKVHHLVLEAFVGPRPAGSECLHGDDDPSNNCLSNLRYGTHSQNMRDRVANGNDRRANQTECIHGHCFTAENTLHDRDGHRICRACNYRRKAEYRSRIRNQRKAA